MDGNLRDHFDRAVGDDPGGDPGEMARAAILQGGRVRRRRGQLGVAAGVVTVLGAVAGVNLLVGPPEPAGEPVTVAAAMMPQTAPSCSAQPVEGDATDAAIFLARGATGGQRAALEAALDGDRRVAASHFEDRQRAYQRFQVLWADNPDLVAAVSADQFPESFRLRLVNAAHYPALRADYAAMPGVDVIIGRLCPASAPVGGLR